jgi:hypothetical protein
MGDVFVLSSSVDCVVMFYHVAKENWRFEKQEVYKKVRELYAVYGNDAKEDDN